MLNWNITSESAIRSTRRPLAPWGIYDVTFKGVELKDIQGKKDPNAHYKILSIKFENGDGYFNVDLFYPKETDAVRPQYDRPDGGKVTMASTFETTMAIVKQTAQVLNPKGFEKMQVASAKFKSFDDVANALNKILTPAIGKETKLKLTGRNRDGKVVAQIPRIVALNKEGQAFICDNYIGDKLFWSDYEAKKVEEYQKATPTAMPEQKLEDPIGNIAEDSAKSEDDMDIDALLA